MITQSGSPALQSHYLSSILPYNNQQELQNKSNIFLKTKQFYKPQKFIWNNPHRTSRKMYPYYHQSNEQYLERIKPIIDQLQQNDRIRSEKERIKKLTEIRQVTRSKFFSRQKVRQELQAKAHANGNNREYVTLQKLRRNSQKFMVPFQGYWKKSPLLKSETSRSTNIRQGMITSTINDRGNEVTQQTYEQSLQKYDNKLAEIRTLVHNQLTTNQKKIREAFSKRKLKNQFKRLQFKNSSTTRAQ